MPATDSFKAIGLKLVSMVCFVIIASLIRYLGQNYPVGQIAFLRAFLALGPVLVFFGWRRELSGVWRTKRIGGHIVRGSIAAIGTFFFVAAYSRLPVVDVTAIAFLAPLITVIFAAVFLHERVRAYRWTAVVVGFAGALLMMFPYLGLTMHEVTGVMIAGAIFALLNAVCAAGAMTQIRRLQETETTGSIVIYFCLFVSLAGLTTLPFGWRVPQTQSEILTLAALGLVGGLGQITHTASYRYASPSLLAPFEYTSMIWAFLIGYFVFGELPTLYVVVGALIVASAGLFVIWRETRLGMRSLRQPSFGAVPPAADIAATQSVKTP